MRTSPQGLTYVSPNVSLQWGNACNTQCFITRPRAVVPGGGARAPRAAPLHPGAARILVLLKASPVLAPGGSSSSRPCCGRASTGPAGSAGPVPGLGFHTRGVPRSLSVKA